MIENGGLNLLYTVFSCVRISVLCSKLSNRFPPIFEAKQKLYCLFFNWWFPQLIPCMLGKCVLMLVYDLEMWLWVAVYVQIFVCWIKQESPVWLCGLCWYIICLRGLGGAASGHVLGGTEIIAPYSHKRGISWQEPEMVTVSCSGGETHTHTRSKTGLKISETQLVKKMLWLPMPQCQHGFARQSTIIFTHTQWQEAKWARTTRGGQEMEDLAQWTTQISPGLKAKP